MRKAKPLTLEQVNELADEFFPQFNAIHERMPEGSSAVDTLAVWDKIAALAGAKKEDQAKNFVGFSNDKVFVDSPECGMPQFDYLDFYSASSPDTLVLG